MSQLTVLIIDQDPIASRQLWSRLQSNGCRVVATTKADDGAVAASAILPDVVVFGQNLGDDDPHQAMRDIRSAMPADHAPSFLSTLPEPKRGDLPSDIPPAHFTSALAGNTTTHAPHGGEGRQRICYDGLEIDRRSHRATIDRQALELTPTEFRILWELADRPGRVFSRMELTDICFKSDKAIKKRTIDAHVKSIRRKLEGRAELVETVRGVGYRLKETEPPVYNNPDVIGSYR